MTPRWLVALLVLAALWTGCTEKSAKTTGPSTDEKATNPPPGEDGGGATPEPAPEPEKKPEPPPPPPPPQPPPPPPPCGAGTCTAAGPFRERYQVTLPQFRGARGFVQFDMAGLYVDGRAEKHGLVFISDAAGFGGDNWIYVKTLDTFPGRPVGAWKIEAEGQGAVAEGGYTGSEAFRRERTHRIRVEWGSGRVRALLDGREYTSVSLPRDVVINGLSLWINETPRAGPEPPYAGAIISNVVVGQ
ncbi:MAG: hypothetical protein HY359_15680 [Candidatus Rokubacteria bacterium]|nr:hypothetical protein [Candidatus Rokubacteria bacterium]